MKSKINFKKKHFWKMTKQEQYKLKFRKRVSDSSSPYYYCGMVQTNDESLALSELLSIIKNKSAESLLEEINNAINEEDFDEYYLFDTAPGDFDLTLLPPNAVIAQMGYKYTIPLKDLKQLLEEWIAFIAA